MVSAEDGMWTKTSTKRRYPATMAVLHPAIKGPSLLIRALRPSIAWRHDSVIEISMDNNAVHAYLRDTPTERIKAGSTRSSELPHSNK